jgi:MFS family permease
MDDSSTPVARFPAARRSRDIPRYSYYALAVLTLVNFLNYIDRQVLPSIAPIMSQDLRLTDTELGAMEAALLLSFTVLAPVFGYLGDRRSRTRLMAGAAVIWSVATALTGIADRFPFLPSPLQVQLPIVEFTLRLSGIALLLCVVRAIVGIGESSYSTITPSLIADYFPPQRRATALGIFQAAIPMGFALGYVIGAILAHFFGWRAAFMVVGIPGVITAVFVWRLREPVRGAGDIADGAMNGEDNQDSRRAELPSSSSWLWTAWHIFRTPDWLFSTAGYTALTFVLGAFALWATSLLVRDKGMSPTRASIVLGIVTLLGGAAGTFGGGWIADRVAARWKSGYFMVCAASSFLGIVPAVLALVSNRPAIYLPAIFFAVMCLFTNNAPFHAILVNSVSPTIRSTAVALNIVVIHTFGDVISRFGVGVLSDSLAAGQFRAVGAIANAMGIDPMHQHLTAALLVAPAGLAISTCFFVMGAFRQKTSRLRTTATHS